MIKKLLAVGFMGLVLGLVPAVAPVQAQTNAAFPEMSAAGSESRAARRFGPYATLRRANEVANYARRYGYNAKIIYGTVGLGTRAYYVDVWR
ncbi:MAG: hypothetical protein R2747_19685 [Pyrinomonadaceae bacterium]